MVEMLRTVNGSHSGLVLLEFTFTNEAVAALQALLFIHLYVRYAVISFDDKIDSLYLLGEELQKRAALDMKEKRRSVFSMAVERAGKSKSKEESDDVSMMQDERYGWAS